MTTELERNAKEAGLDPSSLPSQEGEASIRELLAEAYHSIMLNLGNEDGSIMDYLEARWVEDTEQALAVKPADAQSFEERSERVYQCTQ